MMNGILTAALAAGVLLFSGCEKSDSGKGNGNNGGNAFAGVYTLAERPFYSDMAAVDQAATAVELQEMKLTYAQIIMGAYAYLPQIQLSAYPTEITFNPDGTLKVVEKDTVDGDDVLFPDEEDGLTMDAVKYSLSGNDLMLSIGSAAMEEILDGIGEGNDPALKGAVKSILAKFHKGILVYSASDNTAKITLRYALKGKELSLYVDQPLLQETWEVVQDAKEEILAIAGASDPQLVPVITALIPQVDNMLKTGFTKIEVGMRLTKN